jgi:CDP-glycerol glycerophosphotransferase
LVLDQAEKRVGDTYRAEGIQPALFNRAIWHYANVFDTGEWVTREDRRKFFEQMYRHFVHYVPAGYRYVGGPRGVKYRLIAANAYRSYTLMGRLNGLRLKAKRRSRLARMARRGEL